MAFQYSKARSDRISQLRMRMNGASDLLAKIFGEKGRHARTSVGVSELPLNIPVELDLVLACTP